MELLEYESISNFIPTDCYPSGYLKNQKRVFPRRASHYQLYNGKLVKPSGNENLSVIKETELYDILKVIHDNSGHQCDFYTHNIGKDRYYWPSMLKDITLYVQNCARCAKNQPCLKKPTTPLQPLPVIPKIWFRVGMDLTGPLIDSNDFKYILSVIDHFTRWLVTRPLGCKDAQEVAGGLYSVYCRQSAPVQIISDNGTEFTNQLYKHCIKCTIVN
ncbi:Gag-pol fusion protein [Oopsacas minuta]|uniref:Gag-pol fusion protein n=1 Tax=Oopsacas minuta TaxID=111878 RepID=A0AAV7KC47_9METZ|nr:Gag-pol fusion protein [Oopsacas minuta]